MLLTYGKFKNETKVKFAQMHSREENGSTTKLGSTTRIGSIQKSDCSDSSAEQ